MGPKDLVTQACQRTCASATKPPPALGNMKWSPSIGPVTFISSEKFDTVSPEKARLYRKLTHGMHTTLTRSVFHGKKV